MQRIILYLTTHYYLFYKKYKNTINKQIIVQVIKIPLAAIQEPTPPSHNINISEAVCQTGMWRSIASESKSSLQKIGKDGGEMRDSKSPKSKIESGMVGTTKSPTAMTATVHCER